MRRPLFAFIALLAGCGATTCPEPTTAVASTVAAAPSREAAPEAPPPQGSIRVRPLDVTPDPRQGGFLLRLADEAQTQVLPMIIGQSEAHTIDLRMRGERFERPLTHDLLSSVLDRLESEVLFVHVDKLDTGVFVGSVVIWDGHQLQTFDSRTSDAVALALGHDAPIYVSPAVLAQAGRPLAPTL